MAPPQITTMVVIVCVPYAPIIPTRSAPRYKEYRLHPSHLSAPYFQELLHHTDLSQGASVRVLSLLDTNVYHFDIYNAWLYEGEIFTSFELEEQTQSSLAVDLGLTLGILKKEHPKVVTAEQARTNYDNLLGCYSLGAALDDRKFKDAVTSKLIHLLRSPTSHQSQLIRLLTCKRMKHIVDRHSISSPSYRLLATTYARFASVDEIRALLSPITSITSSSVFCKLWRL